MLRLSALPLFVLSAVGLLFQSGLLKHGRIHRGTFCYYTNLSNLLVVLYELSLFVSGFDPAGGLFRWLSSPGVALSVTLCIYVTHLIFHWVLVPMTKRGQGDARSLLHGSFGNACVHYLTPWLTVLQWLLYQDKTGLTVRHAAAWLVLPLSYFVYAMLRAATGKPIGDRRPLPLPLSGSPQTGREAVHRLGGPHSDRLLPSGLPFPRRRPPAFRLPPVKRTIPHYAKKRTGKSRFFFCFLFILSR